MMILFKKFKGYDGIIWVLNIIIFWSLTIEDETFKIEIVITMENIANVENSFQSRR